MTRAELIKLLYYMADTRNTSCEAFNEMARALENPGQHHHSEDRIGRAEASRAEEGRLNQKTITAFFELRDPSQ